MFYQVLYVARAKGTDGRFGNGRLSAIEQSYRNAYSARHSKAASLQPALICAGCRHIEILEGNMGKLA